MSSNKGGIVDKWGMLIKILLIQWQKEMSENSLNTTAMKLNELEKTTEELRDELAAEVKKRDKELTSILLVAENELNAAISGISCQKVIQKLHHLIYSVHVRLFSDKL